MIYLDDSIMQKGCISSAGSKILENFTAPFNATVVDRLENAEPQEKTKRTRLAEFGLTDPGELPGTTMLCNDVFGHVRRRAAEQELFYLRPTYGTVSRYGLIPTASSIDQIGIVCCKPDAGLQLLKTIAGYDEKDGAMFPEKNYNYKTENKTIRIKTPCSSELINNSDICSQTLQILAFAEICNNISRYDGIKFGYRSSNYKNLEELYIKTRSEAFSPEAKLAAVMGCLILSENYYAKFYEKAMKIRRLVKESVLRLFNECDVLAVSIDNPISVLAGLPSLSFSFNGNPVQLVADVKSEACLQTAWEAEYK